MVVWVGGLFAFLQLFLKTSRHSYVSMNDYCCLIHIFLINQTQPCQADLLPLGETGNERRRALARRGGRGGFNILYKQNTVCYVKDVACADYLTEKLHHLCRSSRKH